jgi:hypothetical protein
MPVLTAFGVRTLGAAHHDRVAEALGADPVAGMPSPSSGAT